MARKAIKIIYVLYSCFILDLTTGICFYNSLKRETSVYGPGRRYCQYFPNGDKNSYSMDIMIGSRFQTRDCMECVCSDQGFRCCGIGIRERNHHVPRDCKLVANGCQPLLVLKSNIYTDCYSGRPVNLYNNNEQFRRQPQPMDMVRQMRRLQRQFRMKKEGESEGPLAGNPFVQTNPFLALIQSYYAKK